MELEFAVFLMLYKCKLQIDGKHKSQLKKSALYVTSESWKFIKTLTLKPCTFKYNNSSKYLKIILTDSDTWRKSQH